MFFMDSKQEISAGGVVYKKEHNNIYWLIAKHSGYHQWAFPKGLIEKDEELEATALREVEEETGIKAKIIKKMLKPETYTYIFNNKKINKTVHYFLMEYVSGSTDDHDWETEEVKWVTFEDAMKELHFAGAKQTLAEAKLLLEHQP